MTTLDCMEVAGCEQCWGQVVRGLKWPEGLARTPLALGRVFGKDRVYQLSQRLPRAGLCVDWGARGCVWFLFTLKNHLVDLVLYTLGSEIAVYDFGFGSPFVK